jgi:hypothetical protein
LRLPRHSFKGVVALEDDGDGPRERDVDVAALLRERAESFMPRRVYLCLQDLTAGYRQPCLLDVKVGVQSWDDDASREKMLRESSKWPLQQVVAFRLSGMHLRRRAAASEGASTAATPAARSHSGAVDDDHVEPSRRSNASRAPVDKRAEQRAWSTRTLGTEFAYSLREDTLVDAFRLFLTGVEGARPTPAQQAVGRDIVSQLQRVRAAMSEQHTWRFFGSSLLFVYEGDAVGDGDDDACGACDAAADDRRSTGSDGAVCDGKRSDVRNDSGGDVTNTRARGGTKEPSVHMIDFGHVWPMEPAGDVDRGYLKGVDGIIYCFRAACDDAASGPCPWA